MEIIFSKLYKIDISFNAATESPEYQNIENFKKYILDLLEQIGKKEPERFYKFKSDFTEVRGLITKILSENEYAITCQSIANRLLDKEVIAQADLDSKKLNKRILKGMLIISLIRMTSAAQKLIILKVDYDDFLSEMTGEILSGLSLRKKVYKAFVCELNNENHIIKTSIYDTNSPVSTYWWDKFLELEVVINNEENTSRAFRAIESQILIPLQKKYKQDYLHLWNATIAYFRGNGEFNLSHYSDEIVGNYLPFNSGLNTTELSSKIDRLPNKYDFDLRFEKTPEVIKKHFKNVLTLSNEILLVLKHDIANPSVTFKSHVDEDGKYLMVKSDEGYEYAKEIERKNLQQNG